MVSNKYFKEVVHELGVKSWKNAPEQINCLMPVLGSPVLIT